VARDWFVRGRCGSDQFFARGGGERIAERFPSIGVASPMGARAGAIMTGKAEFAPAEMYVTGGRKCTWILKRLNDHRGTLHPIDGTSMLEAENKRRRQRVQKTGMPKGI